MKPTMSDFTLGADDVVSPAPPPRLRYHRPPKSAVRREKDARNDARGNNVRLMIGLGRYVDNAIIKQRAASASSPYPR